MNKKYFAYGSCVNVESFKKTMEEAKCEDRFHICGVGMLEGYRLAFTRHSKKWDGGVLDIVESPGNYVLGLVYDIPEEAVATLDRREGAPYYYKRMENVKVKLDQERVEVFTYVVVDKQEEEEKPNDEYFQVVLEGMKQHFPAEYVNRYLIDHCNNKFGTQYHRIR